MKKWFLIAVFALFSFVFTACGNNGAHSGKPDTVGNRYGSANDTNGSAQRTIDTGKVTSKDYSASGGTVKEQDTSKRKDAVKQR
ncbi:MAG: hypothetical protein JSU01_16870 [Bacteroidetes bacterium]|nr:hypothetical protein [Bacteroidota bacterium]